MGEYSLFHTSRTKSTPKDVIQGWKCVKRSDLFYPFNIKLLPHPYFCQISQSCKRPKYIFSAIAARESWNVPQKCIFYLNIFNKFVQQTFAPVFLLERCWGRAEVSLDSRGVHFWRVLCTVHSVMCTVHSIHCTVYSVQCTANTI